MRHVLLLFLIYIGPWSKLQSQPAQNRSQHDTSNAGVTTRLNVPFGTIVKLEVEIYDGDSLQKKEYLETYLLKINSVNDTQQIDTLLMTFEDETKELPNDNFKLHKLVYDRMPPSISRKQIDKMKRNYVGKKFTVMAYETGHFVGIPKDYFKYRPVRAGGNFYFQNYLIVISNLTK